MRKKLKLNQHYIEFRGGKMRTMKKHKDSYTCPHCGYVLPKKEAKVSGWDSQSSLKHVHCPKCGKSGTEKTNSFIHHSLWF